MPPMADSGLVVVRTFNNRQEAELAKSALGAAGIDSIVLGDDAGGVQPGLWEAVGVKVLVRADDGEAAADILSSRANQVGL